MEILRVVENQNENGTYFTIVDVDEMPINSGHFSSKSDALKAINTIRDSSMASSSDHAGNICRSMKSWLQCW